MNLRRAKIVCTLGPASSSPEMVERLLRAGMDVARLNFSHGTHNEHAARMTAVRKASGELQRPVAILADLQGPKIRTGRLEGGKPVSLRAGQPFSIPTAKALGNSAGVSTNYSRLPEEVRKGDRILLADGLIELRVLGAQGTTVRCEVVNGGELGENKGINLPGVRLKIPALTPKDRTDLAFALEQNVNYVAVSFVRTAADVRAAKSAITRAGKNTPVIAKLEKPEAIDNLDAILAVADGVMVARGDLGVEMAPERVPLIQKRIIQRAAQMRLPVITATQMLESMTLHLRPTRAEASDVANAILDGTDAVMLSGETASGRHPIEAVEMMARIAEEADQTRPETDLRRRGRSLDIAETVCESVVHAAQILKVRAIIAFTRSGSTAELISKYRPSRPVYAFCHEERIACRAALYWGVVPLVLPLELDADSTLAEAEAELLRRRLISPGDVLAVVAGSPGKPGQTNQMKLVRVGA